MGQQFSNDCLASLKKSLPIDLTFSTASSLRLKGSLKTFFANSTASYGKVILSSVVFVKSITGSYENIMGFPISKFYQFIL